MAVVAGMFLFGVMLIILYVVSASGFSLHCISVGLLTASTAFVFGVLARLGLNIPQVLSPNIYRVEIGRGGQGCCWACACREFRPRL